jgi:hypothetical protein
MKEAIKHVWTTFLKSYTEQNKERPARLGVFENQSDIFNDYWLEAGLPFNGIDVDTQGALPDIEILLGEFSHKIEGARTLKVHFSQDGDEDGIDISDMDGKTTILRFETNGIGNVNH